MKDFTDCTACGICVAGCAAFRESGDESLTAQGWHLALQAGHDAEELGPLLEACHQTGYCTAVCPEEIDNAQWFTRWRRAAPAQEASEATQRWSQAGNWPGHPLSDLMPRPGAIPFLLGCRFRECHRDFLPHLNKILDDLNLPWGWSAQEACCGGFLEDLGASGGRTVPAQRGKPRPYTGEKKIAVLDENCAAHIPHTLSLWDELLARPEHFRSLQGLRLLVGSRWGNARPRQRIPLLRRFCQATGAMVVNLDPVGGFWGDAQGDWRVRAGHLSPASALEADMVLELHHLNPDNRWLPELFV